MNTAILKPHQIDQAVTLLSDGELVALPTETVYGLAADASNSAAIEKVFIAKGRPTDHPLILHVASMEALRHWVSEVPDCAQILGEKFWPGPLTMVFHKKEHVSDLITAGLPTVAVRVPSHPMMQEVLRHLSSGAVVAPSANFHKKISPTQAQHVLKTLNNRIAAVLDGGTCAIGIESTIIDMTKKTPTILRYGAITQQMIEDFLGGPVDAPATHQEKVAGNMKYHYQPEKPLFLIKIAEIQKYHQTKTAAAFLHISNPQTRRSEISYYQMPDNPTEYAQCLYELLHQIDQTESAMILVERPPERSEWKGVIDRLVKASVK